MKQIIRFTAVILLLVLTYSCKSNFNKKTLLPSVSGKAGEIVVVINKGDWEGAIGSELSGFLASDCPFLPQKEPLYTLVNIVPNTFTSIFKVHRNIILINIDNSITEPGIIYASDKWATPQCVISVNAINSESALELIKEERTKIAGSIEQAERNRVISNSIKYEELGLRPLVNDLVGGSAYFPNGYSLKKKGQDFIWIGYETTYTNQGIFVYKYPVTQDTELTIENIVAKRNEFLKINVPGMFENTYMTTSDFATPSIEYVKYRGREFAQVRGFWEVENDYMGGPFVSHSFYSKDGKEIIVLDAFVYAPKYDKRHYLRQVESLLYSFAWENKQ